MSGRIANKYLMLAVFIILIMSAHSCYSAEVIVLGSNLKDVYYKGEELVISISVLNNNSKGNILNITLINTTIWRIEKRYNRWRNIEKVYNDTKEIGELIEPGQVFSTEIRIKLDFTPARYNLTVDVKTKFTAGAAAETSNYVVKGHLFWIKSSITIPTIVWAIVVDVILVLVALIAYKKLR